MNKEVKQKRLRQHLMRNMMSLAAVSGVIILGMTVFSKQPAEGVLIQAGVIGDTVYFHTFVYDEDQSIISGTLKAVLESQLDTRVLYIEPGLYTGYFEGIDANTDYSLTIRADEGFGDRVLASKALRANTIIGGKIIGYSLEEFQTEQESAPLYITSVIHDPDNTFMSYHLDVAIVYDEFYTETYTLDVASKIASTQLHSMYDSNLHVTVALYAVDQDLERVDLDTYAFISPLILYGSVYVEDASRTALYGSVYVDESTQENVDYRLVLKQGNQVIKTLSLSVPQEMDHYQGIPFEFTGLRKDTLYTLILEARFINALTQKQETQVISSVQARTMKDHSLTITAQRDSDTITLSILTDDPHGVFENFRYQLYMLQTDYEVYIGASTLEVVANNPFETQIQLNQEGTYILYLYADKVFDETTTYSWVQLRKWTFTEGA